MRRYFKSCSAAVKSTAYIAPVRQQIQYYYSIWDPFKKYHIVTLVQKSAARFIAGGFRKESSVTEMLQSLLCSWKPTNLYA